METEILNTLKSRRGEHVSGEDLSRMLGVSRTAVWKDIQRLKTEGYQILSRPHSGYQLVGIPDRLTAQELSWNLHVKRIGKRLHAYGITDSTMEIAHRLAGGGEPEGSVVAAEGQSKGRGRLGRSWVSPKGKGIYLSVILRPSLQLSQVSLVTLLAAVALAQSVQAETGLTPEIKWPNDLMIRGRKAGGILTELNAELNQVHYLVVGIGINVNTPRSALPAHATSLAEEMDGPCDRLALARSLLVHLDRLYDKFLKGDTGEMLEAWRGFAGFLGKRIRVAAQGRVVDGQAVDVDATGALLVRTDTGIVEAVSAGEVLVVR
ncbi:MAG: biotin--[acetyl-CoA-carboxylase] ligase [Candidatus Omnitrophica bacterium]|nr:biotin--[acetyl-CoA-carboxylase] ligase [Candidatus Omnitrophota bacterium]